MGSWAGGGVWGGIGRKGGGGGGLGSVSSNSVCQLFRHISWEVQNDTTYSLYSFSLEGVGLRV